MANTSFHLDHTDSAATRELALALRQQGVERWHEGSDAAGSIAYGQGNVLLALSDVLREEALVAELEKQLPGDSTRAAKDVNVLLAGGALVAAAQAATESAMHMVVSMMSCVVQAEKLSQSGDPLDRAGVNGMLDVAERTQELVKQALLPLGVLRSEAAQLIRRFVKANA